MESELFGPDVSDDPERQEPIEEVGDPVEYFCRTFVNRWVFLPHQRKPALAELQAFIAEMWK